MYNKGDKNSKLRIEAVVLLIVLLLTCSCGEVAIPNPTPPISLSSTQRTAITYDWANNWLKGIPCKAPCFEGITPGVTKANDALKILKSYPYTRNISTSKFTGYFGHNIAWNWYNSDDENNIYYEPSDDIVYAIRFRTSGIQLGRIIALYGEPDRIGTRTMKGDDSHIDNLIYTVRVIYNQGLILVYSSIGNPPNLSTSLEFESPLFYDPKIEAKYNSAFQVSTWQGMKDFYFYCTDKGRCLR